MKLQLFASKLLLYLINDNIFSKRCLGEVNVRVLGKGLELLNANGGRFEIN